MPQITSTIVTDAEAKLSTSNYVNEETLIPAKKTTEEPIIVATKQISCSQKLNNSDCLVNCSSSKKQSIIPTAVTACVPDISLNFASTYCDTHNCSFSSSSWNNFNNMHNTQCIVSSHNNCNITDHDNAKSDTDTHCNPDTDGISGSYFNYLISNCVLKLNIFSQLILTHIFENRNKSYSMNRLIHATNNNIMTITYENDATKCTYQTTTVRNSKQDVVVSNTDSSSGRIASKRTAGRLLQRMLIPVTCLLVVLSLPLTQAKIRSHSGDPLDPVGNIRHVLPELQLDNSNNSVTDVKFNVGSTAFLPCRFPSFPRPHENRVSWVRRWDWTILTAGRTTYSHDDRFIVLHRDGTNDWTLQIKFVEPEDNGTYECQVHSGSGFMSQFVNLHVVTPRAIILEPNELTVKNGDSFSLTCIIQQSLEPPVYVMWLHGGVPVNYAPDRPRLNVQLEVNGPRSRSILSIRNAKYTDSGNYTCTAPNAINAWVLVYVTEGDTVAAVQRRHPDSSSSATSGVGVLSSSAAGTIVVSSATKASETEEDSTPATTAPLISSSRWIPCNVLLSVAAQLLLLHLVLAVHGTPTVAAVAVAAASIKTSAAAERDEASLSSETNEINASNSDKNKIIDTKITADKKENCINKYTCNSRHVLIIDDRNNTCRPAENARNNILNNTVFFPNDKIQFVADEGNKSHYEEIILRLGEKVAVCRKRNFISISR